MIKCTGKDNERIDLGGYYDLLRFKDNELRICYDDYDVVIVSEKPIEIWIDEKVREMPRSKKD